MSEIVYDVDLIWVCTVYHDLSVQKWYMSHMSHFVMELYNLANSPVTEDVKLKSFPSIVGKQCFLRHGIDLDDIMHF